MGEWEALWVHYILLEKLPARALRPPAPARYELFAQACRPPLLPLCASYFCVFAWEGEVRTTATCAANVKTGRKVVSVAKIYSTAGLMQRALLGDSDSERDSIGPMNLHLLPLLVYQDHLWNPAPGVTLRSRDGCRMIVPSTTTVQHQSGEKVFASVSDFQVAAGMIGLGGLGDAILRPHESVSEADWKRAISRHTGAILSAVRSIDTEEANFVSGNLISASRVVCEDLSAAGLVDLIGTPYLIGALPDSLTSPHSVLSVIAAMTRLRRRRRRRGRRRRR